MVQIYSTCEQFIRTIPALVQDENNIEDIDTDGEDHCYDEACHIMMHRPVKSYAIQAPVRRPPKDMNEVARLELKQIKEDAQRAFEAEMMGVFNDW
jgi:uncharacterized protein YrzB (UPF0473 family)